MDAGLADLLARLPRRLDRYAAEPAVAPTAPGSFRDHLRSAGLIWRFAALLGAHIVEIGLLIAGWTFIGSGALSGRLDEASLAAWALCLISTIPVRMLSNWFEGVIAVGCGALLKERLLAGATATDADAIRRKGIGELIGEVLETEAIERLGVSGGLHTVLAALELTVAPLVLAWGASAGLEISLLIGWVAITLFVVRKNTRWRSRWTTLRLTLTHRLVERMIAHRTRLAQQASSEWHREEDTEHERYADLSKSLDRSTVWLEAALPRGYVIAALAVLAPAFLSDSSTVEQRAITLGAILFIGDAFQRLTFGMSRGAAAWIAWQGVKPMFDVAGQPTGKDCAIPEADTQQSVLRAESVTFRHDGRHDPSVRSCTLSLANGDFVLLEGESGSGKSTFVSLLTGHRKPSAGVILAGGLDLCTAGDRAWRRQIAAAPQYHENHIFSASLGFNLLLGRPYPHSPEDCEEARAICQELGLGPLLDRMPAGIDQMVGETGWQLSHGERSRIFLARALLQRASVVILDESLAALDPTTLRQCLECLFRRARTLLVIAHP